LWQVTKNGVRSMLSTVRLKAVNEDKSTKSAGRLFHTLMTRMLKIYMVALHTIYIATHRVY